MNFSMIIYVLGWVLKLEVVIMILPIICALSWIVMSLIGALPFYLTGTIPSYIDAVF